MRRRSRGLGAGGWLVALGAALGAQTGCGAHPDGVAAAGRAGRGAAGQGAAERAPAEEVAEGAAGAGLAPSAAGAGAPSPTRYLEAFLAVEGARTEVRHAAAARDDAEQAARARPTPAACAALTTRAGLLDGAWHRLTWAYHAAAEALPPAPDRVDHQRSLALRAQEAQVQRGLDARHHAAWAEACAAVRPEPAVALAAAEPSAADRCGALGLDGAVVHVATPPPAAVDVAAVVALLTEVGAAVEAPWDWALVAVVPADGAPLPVAMAEASHVAVDRGQPGRGRPPVASVHLPAWARLEAAVVLGQGPAHLPAEAVRGLLRVQLAGLPLVEGADCGPDPAGTWGASDVGGVLGGAIPGGLRMLADGRWRALWPVAPGPRLAGNPADRVALAPIELALLGLLPLARVPAMTFLRRAEVADADHLRALGTCRLDGPGWGARFGHPAARTAPWRVGLVVWGGDAATAARWAQAFAAFAAPPQPWAPVGATFSGATRGLGHLVRPAARWRAACAAPEANLP